MRRKAFVWLLPLVLLLLPPGSSVLATPTLPHVIVNHSTRECGVSILGDDCSWCDPPPGWEVLGPFPDNQCPEGYVQVDQIDMQCRLYKNQFCCSGWQHQGDCEDMVIHEANGLCAFVDDIQDCILPEGWTSRPADVSPSRWACPHDYRWSDPIACLASAPTREPTASTGPTLMAVPATPPASGAEVYPRNVIPLLIACLVLVFVAVAAVGLALAAALTRRRHL